MGEIGAPYEAPQNPEVTEKSISADKPQRDPNKATLIGNATQRKIVLTGRPHPRC